MKKLQSERARIFGETRKILFHLVRYRKLFKLPDELKAQGIRSHYSTWESAFTFFGNKKEHLMIIRKYLRETLGKWEDKLAWHCDAGNERLAFEYENKKHPIKITLTLKIADITSDFMPSENCKIVKQTVTHEIILYYIMTHTPSYVNRINKTL